MMLEECWAQKYRGKYYSILQSQQGSSDQHASPDATLDVNGDVLRQQLFQFVEEEVACALRHLRRKSAWSRIRRCIGVIASTITLRNAVPLTGASLLYNASRAAEAVGFDELDQLISYASIGKRWLGASIQQFAAPPALDLTHTLAGPVFGLLARLDDLVVVGAVYGALGYALALSRFAIETVILERSADDIINFVERAARGYHTQWIEQNLLSLPLTRELAAPEQ